MDTSVFENAYSMTNRLRSRYLALLQSFNLFEKMKEQRSPLHVGQEEAEKNAQIHSKYKGVFQTVEYAVNYHFLVELAKFFDINPQSLTLVGVLRYTKNNLSYLTKENLRAFVARDGRKTLEFFFDKYEPLRICDIEDLESKLVKKKDLILRLKNYRDKFLAHDDIKKEVVTLNQEEIVELMGIVEETIGLMYLKLDLASNVYGNYIEVPRLHLDNLVSDLQK